MLENKCWRMESCFNWKAGNLERRWTNVPEKKKKKGKKNNFKDAVQL